MPVVAPTSPQALRKCPVVVIDWETTWEDNEDRTQHPVSVALVHCDLGVAGSERVVFTSTIKPKVRIREEATKIHGISNEMVEKSPSVEDLVPDLERFLDGRVLASYNIPFDVPILQRYVAEIPYGTLDPLIWAKVVDQYKPSKKLVDVAGRRGITFAAHDASADALTTAKIMPMLLAELKGTKKFDPKSLDSVAGIWAYTQKEALAWERWYRSSCETKGRPEPRLDWHRILGEKNRQTRFA